MNYYYASNSRNQHYELGVGNWYGLHQQQYNPRLREVIASSWASTPHAKFNEEADKDYVEYIYESLGLFFSPNDRLFIISSAPTSVLQIADQLGRYYERKYPWSEDERHRVIRKRHDRHFTKKVSSLSLIAKVV